jgi:hypothetical protein
LNTRLLGYTEKIVQSNFCWSKLFTSRNLTKGNLFVSKTPVLQALKAFYPLTAFALAIKIFGVFIYPLSVCR